MKKILVLITLAVALLMLIGCGAKQKMEDKLDEKIVETALGGNVDIDGEEVTIEGEDGAVTFGAGEWPDSDLAKSIPVFKDGNITSVVNSEGYVFIIMEEVDEGNFKEYLDKVKSRFTEEAYESKFEDTIAYSATDAEGIAMIVSYTTYDKVLSIQASMPEKTE